jgi:hypothetical protein
VQTALISQAVRLMLVLHIADQKAAANGHELGDLGGRQYLAWVGSLRRVLHELGPPVAPAAHKPLTMQEHMAARAKAAAPP